MCVRIKRQFMSAGFVHEIHTQWGTESQNSELLKWIKNEIIWSLIRKLRHMQDHPGSFILHNEQNIHKWIYRYIKYIKTTMNHACLLFGEPQFVLRVGHSLSLLLCLKDCTWVICVLCVYKWKQKKLPPMSEL